MKILFPDRWPLWICLALAMFSALAGLFLAAHYPVMPPLAVAACLLAGALAFRYWQRVPLLLLGLVPVLGFAPWTGWLSFEELDLLVLACASGAYAALGLGAAAQAPRVPVWRRTLAYSPLTNVMLTLFVASGLLALFRGFADAGGFEFGFFQGYQGSMNSLRQAKSLGLVLLLLPLWQRSAAGRPGVLDGDLNSALLLALLGISLGALWERWAHTGLLNFSSDYRSTSLFWEMHVGGAAFDACLALCMPFVLLALLRERRPWRFALLAVQALMGLYACVTTFSRGVYLAAPIATAVLLGLFFLQRRRAALPGGAAGLKSRVMLRPTVLMTVLMLAFVLAAGSMFDGSGYRGLLALLGLMAVLVYLPTMRMSGAQLLIALLIGAALALLLTSVCWVLSDAVPKLAYLSYALALALALAMCWRTPSAERQMLHVAVLAGAWFWLVAEVVIVADYWGGQAAGIEAQHAAWLLAPLWPLMFAWPQLRPFRRELAQSWRGRSLFGLVFVLAGVLVASLSGGEYIHTRASTAREDLQGRFHHWRQGLAMLSGPQDWLLGKGSGRFSANHALFGPADEHNGDYRLKQEDGRPFLVLSGGTHPLGFGELFRVSQRIDAPQGEVKLSLRLRARRDLSLHTEICEKHLLYTDSCIGSALAVKAGPGAEWQQLSLSMKQAPSMGGVWFAPRLIAFSIAVDSTGGVVDIAELQLHDATGRELLNNGDFSADMARWFFSSDRYHLPWHIKNLGLHVLFEQGLLGLSLLAGLVFAALARLSVGRGREHPQAPALAAALAGVLVVGLFDSLIDAPRIAFMFYALLLLALGLRQLPPEKS